LTEVISGVGKVCIRTNIIAEILSLEIIDGRVSTATISIIDGTDVHA
jgi:hypothetical protein